MGERALVSINEEFCAVDRYRHISPSDSIWSGVVREGDSTAWGAKNTSFSAIGSAVTSNRSPTLGRAWAWILDELCVGPLGDARKEHVGPLAKIKCGMVAKVASVRARPKEKSSGRPELPPPHPSIPRVLALFGSMREILTDMRWILMEPTPK